MFDTASVRNLSWATSLPFLLKFNRLILIATLKISCGEKTYSIMMSPPGAEVQTLPFSSMSSPSG